MCALVCVCVWWQPHDCTYFHITHTHTQADSRNFFVAQILILDSRFFFLIPQTKLTCSPQSFSRRVRASGDQIEKLALYHFCSSAAQG